MNSTTFDPKDKTQKAVLAILIWRTVSMPKEALEKYPRIVVQLMINDLYALMGDDWSIDDLNKYRKDLPDALSNIGALLAMDFITKKHAREILKAVWDLPYLHPVDYIIENKILEEAEGDELLSIVKTVVKDNPKAVEQLLGGKDKAIGFLIGQVMKAARGKANPQQAQEMLKAEMEVK